jgi:hypothetical protein
VGESVGESVGDRYEFCINVCIGGVDIPPKSKESPQGFTLQGFLFISRTV